MNRAVAATLGAAAAGLLAPQLASATPGCETMQKGATQKIEVCLFYDNAGGKVSNVRFQVRNGSGGGYLQVTPIAIMSVGGRTDPLNKRFGATGYALTTAATRTTGLCWGNTGRDMFDARQYDPCGTFTFSGGHLTFEAIRYNQSYKEIDRLTHK